MGIAERPRRRYLGRMQTLDRDLIANFLDATARDLAAYAEAGPAALADDLLNLAGLVVATRRVVESAHLHAAAGAVRDNVIWIDFGR